MFLFYDSLFLHVCTLQENLLFSTLIRGSVFSNLSAFTGYQFHFVKFLGDRSTRYRDITIFWIFKRWLFAIFDYSCSEILMVNRALTLKCVIMTNFVTVVQTTAVKICVGVTIPYGMKYGNLWRFSRWRPSAILDFYESKTLSADRALRVSMRHHGRFWGFGPRMRHNMNKNHKGTSTGYNGYSGVLIVLVSIAVPEKLLRE